MGRKLIMCAIVVCLTLGASLSFAAPEPLFHWAQTPTTLTFYGQSTIVLAHGDTKIIIDPWLTGNPWKVATADEIDVQYILVSHAHGDHVGDPPWSLPRSFQRVTPSRCCAPAFPCSIHPGGWN